MNRKLRGWLLGAVALGAVSALAEGGWKPLFRPDYSDGDFDPAIWHTDAEGCLTAEKDVAFWTKDDYARFELECEYNLEPAGNSGIVIYCTDPQNWIPNSVEIQLIDNEAPKWKGLNPRQANLAFFGHQAPTSNPAKPAGQWNKVNVIADGPRLKVTLNGVVVNECNLTAWTDAKKLPDGGDIPPWLSRPWSELERAGRIGFQGRHAGAGVRFRNIRIRPLPRKRPLRRLMSFNVRMGCGHDDPFKLASGSLGHLPQCADVIRRFDPDVCGLQEVDRKSARAGGMDQTQELAKLVGLEGSWVEKIPNYGVATLYRERPFRVSKVLMKGSLHTRALMISEYADCVVANTHFPLADWACTNAARIVRETLRPLAAKKPVFLLGDLNSTPDSATIRSLQEDFDILSDTRVFTWSAKKPDRTIDYIMVDKAHAAAYRKAKAQVLAAPEATDHVALVVDLGAPEPVNVPELLTCEDGTKVSTVEQWEGKRRGEIQEFFTREEYGRRPVGRPDGLTFETVEPDKVMMSGRAIRKRIRASWKAPRGDWSFVFTAFVPKRAVDAGVKSPSFVLICNRSVDNIDPTREKKSFFWPAEEIVDRGYAAIAFWNGDLAPDDKNPVFTNGVYKVYGDRGADTWGALSAWAWGASRVMDWIETEPTLDAQHVGVVGHSRGGKTALVAGVTDKRFAMACSNCSGCSGAKLNHIDLPKSESVKIITGAFRHWFSLEYDKWADRECEMPYDQHEWIALMAPRLVAVASAGEDDWAGQLGEFHAARLASPAWELYGRKGLVAPEEPPTVGDRPVDGVAYQEGSVSYHLRPGQHTLSAYDWHRYLDFADRHGWRNSARFAVVKAAEAKGATPADVLLSLREQVRRIWNCDTNVTIVLKAGPNEVINRELRNMSNGKSVIWTDPEKGKPLTEPVRRSMRPLSRFDMKNFGLNAWWLNRLAQKREQIRKSGGKIDLVMFGDSITHRWENIGTDSLRELEKSWSVLDLGYGGDRTDSLLWRGEHGELDGYQAKCVMLMCGINNVSCKDTAEDVAAGIRAVLDLIARKQPQATVLLLPIFPSGPNAADKRRQETEKANRLIRDFADGTKVVWVDFNDKWLDAQGDVQWVMPDRVHPNAEGYRTIWLPAIRPYLEKYCGK